MAKRKQTHRLGLLYLEPPPHLPEPPIFHVVLKNPVSIQYKSHEDATGLTLQAFSPAELVRQIEILKDELATIKTEAELR